MQKSLVAAVFAFEMLVPAQGSVPPVVLGVVDPLPSLGPPSVPGTSVQQVHMVHLPTDPAHVYQCSLTVGGLPAAWGGTGGSDLITGKYDVLADVFTPTREAVALNTTGNEFGLMLHHTGLHAVFDRPPGPAYLASRPSLASPWSIVGPIIGLPPQSSYDPALADYYGQTYLLYVLGTDIVMSPIDLNIGVLLSQPYGIVTSARPGSTANSPTPVLDSSGQLIGVSHHDALGSDNDHYMSLDLDPNTPPVLMRDTTSWSHGGAYIGGRFFDAATAPSPSHVFTMDTYWFTGGRGVVGQTMGVLAYVPPGPNGTSVSSFLMLGSPFLPTGIAVPPIGGLLGLSPGNILFLPFPPHGNANGEAPMTLAIPNVPAYRGLRLAAQMVSVDVARNAVTFANTAAFSVN